MRLDEFCRTVHQEAVKFETAYKKAARGGPSTNYPTELPAADWWEQFLAFLGPKATKK